MAVIHITNANFTSEVLESDKKVLVDFWAPWCAPCRAVAPFLEQLDTEFAGRLRIAKMNVDENGEIPGALGVRSIPTFVMFRGGKAVQGAVGALSKEQLVAFVTPHLEAKAP